MHPEIREKVMAALAPERGSVELGRVMNLHGPLDFRGEAGAEAWALAMGAGNWRAAAMIAQYGYQPPGQVALGSFLVRHRLVACDLGGVPAGVRLLGSLQNLGGSDEADDLGFLLEMGKPWAAADLNGALFLAAQFKKGPSHVRLLCAAGGKVDCRLEAVQTELLNRVALRPSDLAGLSWNGKKALLAEAEMHDSVMAVVLMHHPGATPLLAAAAIQTGGRLGPWIEEGADVAAADAGGRTALHWCCRKGNAEGARRLLARDVSLLERVDASGARPMDEAMWSSNGRVLEALLAAGAPLPAEGYDAEECAPGAVLRITVLRGAAIAPLAESGDRERALFQAVDGGYWELASALLAGNVFHPVPCHCLLAAAMHGDLRCIRLLLEAGADPNCRDEQERSCLHLLVAAPEPDPAAVRLLIDAGADVNALDRRGSSPLHLALVADRLELAGALLEAGADPNQRYRDYWAALARCVSAEGVALLLAAKAKLSGSDAEAAVTWQAAYGTDAAFFAILRALKNPSAVRARGGDTLLHIAAADSKSEDAARLRAVMAVCPEVDVAGEDGRTPLMQGARYGTAAAVQCLLAAGARTTVTDNEGMTAADHARKAGRWNLAEELAGLR